MTSWFRDAATVSHAAADVLYAEAITIRPMAKPDANGRPIADPSRPVTTIQAIYDEPSTQSFPDAKGHASSSAHLVSSTKPTVEFDTAALPYAVKIGDLVVRLETGDVLAVADPGDDGLGRTTLKLTAKA